MTKPKKPAAPRTPNNEFARIEDCSIRYLPDVIAIVKEIVERGLEAEFVAGCKDKHYFVVATDSTRKFIHDFMVNHKLTPENQPQFESMVYGKRCD
ncbi:hypothetical protein ABZT49_14250 [Methylobacterium sp. EM32]|uniref:hypothetical protein n=1 Tax=Methylobacterium sp. EM32 TaxID=3163481 RepID=UPI0033BE9627